ncbi:MAG: hypothetical protein HY270_01395 [Deltaproteobacteria bacterium]|nr:hypothetical protein [Deltaproteobacteria bacterium]
MANLTQKEFQHAVELLAAQVGLQRLRDKLVYIKALVTRRRAASAEKLADQLYLLSSGLRRQVPATIGFYAVWNDALHSKLGEDGEKRLEEIAEKVNACLGENDAIIEEKRTELDAALAEYEQALASATGPELARMDMLLKAVPAVAAKLRAAPLSAVSSAPASEG